MRNLTIIVISLGPLGACTDQDPVEEKGGCPPGAICECAGSVQVTLTTPQPLGHVRVAFTRTWSGPNGRTEQGVRDECAPEAGSGTRFELARTASGLSIMDGGFGLQPPNVISLSVHDLGDCTGSDVTTFVVEDHVLAGAPFGVCDLATAVFDASAAP